MANVRSRSRGTKDWAGGVGSTVALTSTQAILLTFDDLEPITVLRIRGNFLIKGTPNNIADADVVGLGAIVVSDASAAVGGVSVPGPIADPSAPWLWHQYVPLQAGSAGLLGDDIGSVVRVEVDSKAMRKLGLAEKLVIVGELSTGEYATVLVNVGIRTLALHS